MPTVFRYRNILFKIYPKDHEPPHVHAICGKAEAKFRIASLECLENHGFSEKSIRRIKVFLTPRIERLMEVWNEYQD